MTQMAMGPLHIETHGHHGLMMKLREQRGHRDDAPDYASGPSTPTRGPTSAPHSPSHSLLNGLKMHPAHILSAPPMGLEQARNTPLRESFSSRDSFASESFDRPPSVAPPLPHLPLKKKSSGRLRQQRAASPHFTSPLNQSGFRFPKEQPSPTRSTPATHSRQSSASRGYTEDLSSAQPSPFGSPVSSQRSEQGDGLDALPVAPCRPRASSQTQYKPRHVLKPSASIPNLAQLRKEYSRDIHSPQNYRGESRRSGVRDSYLSMLRRDPHVRPIAYADEFRSSYRSGFTNASSGFLDASGTERSSIITERSGFDSDVPTTEPDQTDATDVEKTDAEQTDAEDGGMTVEDAIDMYEHGFQDDSAVEEIPDGSDEGYSSQVPMNGGLEEPQTPPRARRHSTMTMMRDSALGPELPENDHDIPYVTPARQSRVITQTITVKEPAAPAINQPPHSATQVRSFTEILAPRQSTQAPKDRKEAIVGVSSIPRDQYGFKKTSQHITVQQYDAWNGPYTEHVERRRKKWVHLMRQHGLPTENPVKFPPRTEKVKRFIRKGIPPEWRGAAWFWYAGGPEWMAKKPGLYWELIEQVGDGKLSEQDREHIERDLNRTFPDNVKFRPESRASMNAAHMLDTRATELTPECETPILRALRRVLQAFAVHNPGIGYCQSLNFLAGLLLIFLDEDEEKAFILLDIITTLHLPGTHSRVLEANIDIGVLMSCIRESMPAIWNKIDDTSDMEAGGSRVATAAARLPTVSLAMTSWFMSLFVGSFPIETVLRVWDSFFYEGSKTLFRIALTIMKIGEAEIRAINDPMEVFQIIQTLPRRLIDANALMELCFRRRNGFGHVSQDTIDSRRIERRKAHRDDMKRISGMPLGRTLVDSDAQSGKSGHSAARKFKAKRRVRTERAR